MKLSKYLTRMGMGEYEYCMLVLMCVHIGHYLSSSQISPEELSEVMLSLGDPRGMDDIKQMISEADPKGLGVVTYEEFEKMLRKKSQAKE